MDPAKRRQHTKSIAPNDHELFCQLESRVLLSAEFELPIGHNGFGAANSIIEIPADHDTWGFTALGTGWASIGVNGSGGMPTRIQLFDDEGDAITSEKRSEDGRGTAATLVYLLEGERYIARVRSNGFAVGQYHLTASTPISVADRVRETIPISPLTGDGGVDSTLGDPEDFRGAPDTRLYQFTPIGSGNVRIQITPLGSGLDPLLVLHDSDGDLIAVRDSNGPGGPEFLQRDLIGGETYILIASSWSGDGLFLLDIDGPLAPPDGPPPELDLPDRLDAREIALDSRTGDGSRPGAIDNTQDSDTYRFTPIRSGDATILVRPAGPLDVAIAVYDSSGDRIGSVRDVRGDGGDETIELSVSGGAVYYIVADGFRGSIGAYTVHIDTPDNPLDDRLTPGEMRRSKGIWLAARDGDGSRRGRIGSASDDDAFRFTPRADGDVRIRIDGRDNLDAEVAIFDASGRQIAPWTDDRGPNGRETLVFPGEAGEVYFVQVSGDDGSTGRYHVRVNGRTDNGDGPRRMIGSTPSRNARGLTIGDSERSGRIRGRTDNDLFWFVPTQATTISIQLSPSDDLDVRFSIRNGAGKPVRPAIDDFGPGRDEVLTILVSAGELYYLDVRGVGGDLGRFGLRLEI